ncbi:hypothetical protein [Nostoc sp.]|uniref:hypothetical protein n=1 Tax=Nostoc sp. TaxID=1180 RepID=UPI002FF60CDB
MKIHIPLEGRCGINFWVITRGSTAFLRECLLAIAHIALKIAPRMRVRSYPYS